MNAPSVDMVRRQVGGQWRCEWRARCDQCGAVAQRHWHELSDPEIAAKNFKSQGWRLGKVSLCPTCAKTPRPAPAPRAPLPNTVLPMTDRKTTLQPRTLTIEERARVREMLEVYFDAERGFYTDGYSDKKVGQDLDLPWASVAALPPSKGPWPR